MQHNENIFVLQDISKSFPGVKALDGISFEVRKGEVHALVGENGAGKSTLMKILSGIYKRDTGSIILDGEEVAPTTPKMAERLGISIIHQELNLIGGLSVAENIYLGRQPRIYGMVDWKRMYRDAAELFKRLKIDIDTTQLVRHLSVAQQQMVEIAKAVSHDAKVVIMDEPTATLTPQETRILFEIIRNLKSQDVSIIFITHRLDEIYEVCDRLTVLRDGRYIGTRNVCDVSKNEMIAMMIGRELTQQFPERNSTPGEVCFRVENLCRGRKVQNVSFELRRGEVLGFAGLVGSGRTETMRAIFGADKRECGAVFMDGIQIDTQTPRRSIRARIAFVTEDRKGEGLFLNLPVSTNIVTVALKKIKKMKLLNMAKEREVSEAYVKSLRIATPSIHQKAIQLSGGNQQKVVLAKWLFSDSQIIIMDEPTRGIDVGAKREIYELINQLIADGKSVIVVSSEMEEIMGISDRIVVLREGRVAQVIEKKDFSQHTITQYAVCGEDA